MRDAPRFCPDLAQIVNSHPRARPGAPITDAERSVFMPQIQREMQDFASVMGIVDFPQCQLVKAIITRRWHYLQWVNKWSKIGRIYGGRSRQSTPRFSFCAPKQIFFCLANMTSWSVRHVRLERCGARRTSTEEMITTIKGWCTIVWIFKMALVVIILRVTVCAAVFPPWADCSFIAIWICIWIALTRSVRFGFTWNKGALSGAPGPQTAWPYWAQTLLLSALRTLIDVNRWGVKLTECWTEPEREKRGDKDKNFSYL